MIKAEIIPKNNIINGKNIMFIIFVLSELRFDITHIDDKIIRLVRADMNGLFLYVYEAVIEQETAPRATQIIDKISAKFIGFLILSEIAERIIDKIKVTDIPQIKPDITDNTKLSFLLLIFFSFLVI